MKKKIIIKTKYDPTSLIKEANQERIDRINASRKLSTQTIPNKKKVSRAQQKHRDYKEINL